MTHTARFLSAGGFHYEVSCAPVQALDSHFNVRIATQWDAARNPDDKQVALSLTLSRGQLGTLVDVLQRSITETA